MSEPFTSTVVVVAQHTGVTVAAATCTRLALRAVSEYLTAAPQIVSFTRFTGRSNRMPIGTLLHWCRSVPVVVVRNGVGAPNWFEANRATRVAVGQNAELVGAPASVTP